MNGREGATSQYLGFGVFLIIFCFGFCFFELLNQSCLFHLMISAHMGVVGWQAGVGLEGGQYSDVWASVRRIL